MNQFHSKNYWSLRAIFTNFIFNKNKINSNFIRLYWHFEGAPTDGKFAVTFQKRNNWLFPFRSDWTLFHFGPHSVSFNSLDCAVIVDFRYRPGAESHSKLKQIWSKPKTFSILWQYHFNLIMIQYFLAHVQIVVKRFVFVSFENDYFVIKTMLMQIVAPKYWSTSA